jgi:hypothetical protein
MIGSNVVLYLSLHTIFHLKVQCHKMLQVFFMNHLPQAPKNNIMVISNFFSQKFTEIFTSQGAPPVSTTPVAKLPPLSTTPAANFPLLSTPPVANSPSVSTTLAVNLPLVPLVSLIPGANCHHQY